ncbi:hypothetical protein CR513_48749, partial [Mucuna pruriens]
MDPSGAAGADLETVGQYTFDVILGNNVTNTITLINQLMTKDSSMLPKYIEVLEQVEQIIRSSLELALNFCELRRTI